jgi:hypothetical protein
MLCLLACAHQAGGKAAQGGKGKAAAQVVVTDGTPGAAAAAGPAGAVGGTPEPTGVSPMQVSRHQVVLHPIRAACALAGCCHHPFTMCVIYLQQPAPSKSSSVSWSPEAAPLHHNCHHAALLLHDIGLYIARMLRGVAYACRLTAAPRVPPPCPDSWAQRRCLSR